jgi:hypothetical protein
MVMKMKVLFVLALVLVMASAGYAQTGFNGKWATDPPAAPAAAPAAPPAGGAPAAGAGGGAGGRGGGRGGGGGNAMQMDLTVTGNKVTGTLTEGGATLMILEGTVDGKKAIMKTKRDMNGGVLDVTWTVDMTDDNTLSVTREFPNGIPQRGGAAAPAGGAPPAAGAAPAAGAPPAAAAGAPPAGAPPAGGGAGGRGGGGGGGGRGGGAIAAVILHRAK